ncbi:unnamed protein product [Soboliphyme baturini]|uniref:BZIP domain-containing protein n=1 Tax=Soboliphyme baturini TaxID=241478 RepID=A0A183IA25_9BILA|nr:unnamed protein product [Soboliphyme baturini]
MRENEVLYFKESVSQADDDNDDCNADKVQKSDVLDIEGAMARMRARNKSDRRNYRERMRAKRQVAIIVFVSFVHVLIFYDISGITREEETEDGSED